MENHPWNLGVFTENFIPVGADIICTTKDKLKNISITQVPSIVYVNTCLSSSSHGEHFVLFYVHENSEGKLVNDWFCSYGKSYSYYGIEPPFPIEQASTKRIQNIHSNLCGYYCFVVACMRFYYDKPLKAIEDFYDGGGIKHDATVLLWAETLSTRYSPLRTAWDFEDETTHGKFSDTKSMLEVLRIYDQADQNGQE